MRAPGSPQRRLIDLVVRDYKDATAAFTTGLDAQAAVVTSWWCDPGLGERRFTARRAGALTCRRDVDDAVHDCGLRACDASDVIVLVVTGHGRRGTSARHTSPCPTPIPAGCWPRPTRPRSW